MYTLESRGHGVLAFNWQSGGDCRLGESERLVSALQVQQTPAVLAVNISDGRASLDATMGTLGARSGGQEVGAQTRGVVLAMDALTYDARGNGDGATAYANRGREGGAQLEASAIAPSLRTPGGGSSQAIVLRNREGKPGGGKGPLLSAERERTLGTGNDQVLFTVDKQSGLADTIAPTLKTDLAHQMGPVVANTVMAREGKGWNPARDVGNGAVQSGIPRRLMPVETERLMGWPDGHTAVGIDEQGREYALSDTARYRLCGNGVASPVAAWIAWRLRWALEAQKTEVLAP